MSKSDRENNSFILKQLTRYRDLLANFSQQNKELYYRPGKASSLCLSADINPKQKKGHSADVEQENTNHYDSEESSDPPDSRAFEFTPFTMQSASARELLANQKLDLTDHFGLRARKNPPAESQLEKIRSADIRYQKEFGISGAWLLGPFLLWRDTSTHTQEELLISPIFKLPVDVTRTKQKRWELLIEEAGLRFNPSLQLALSKRLGLELTDEVESATFIDAITSVASQMATDDRTVTVIYGSGKLMKLSSSPQGEEKRLSDPIENALRKICTELATSKKRCGPVLPTILGKMKSVHDEDGNVTGRRPTSIAQDLSETDRKYYEAVTFNHFVIVDSFYVDHISATRLPLFRDYEQVLEQLAAHPIVSELLGEGPLPTGTEKTKLPRELDSYKEKENYFVIPTDSSQHSAISLSSKGSAIVIQGPPGTGKSQTIANLIADKIATGKRILFLAEKRAALDVVYTRLKQAGIDKQAVLIHSSEVNKKELYASFLELAKSKPKDEDKAGWERTADRLDQLKSELHQYYDAAIVMHRNTGLTVSDILALHASQTVPGDSDDGVQIGRHFSPQIMGRDLDEIATELGQLQTLIASLSNYEMHPWIHKRRDFVVTAETKSAFEETCEHLVGLLSKFRSIEQSILTTLPGVKLQLLSVELVLQIVDPEGVFADPVTLELMRLVRALFFLNQDPTLGAGRSSPSELAATITKELTKNAVELAKAGPLYALFRPEADPELVDEMATYFKVPLGMFAPLSQRYWRAKRICRVLFTDRSTKRIHFSHIDERPFKAFKSYRTSLAELKKILAKSTFDADILSESAPWNQIEGYVKICLRLLERAGTFATTIVTLEQSGTSLQRFLQSDGYDLIRLLRKVGQDTIERRDLSAQITRALLQVDTFFEDPQPWDIENYDNTINRITALKARIGECEIIERVDLICRTLGERRGIANFRAVVLPLLLRQNGNWGQRVKKEVARIWYDEARTTHLQIRGFDRNLLESSIAEFCRVESAHRNAAQIAVNDVFARRWTSESPDQWALDLLRNESQKQRRILYPREVMEKGALETMLRLKPCWMMSPLSVSQILPLVQGMFDVIVFDEASQVRVEDAIPAIYRASTLVVVGDPKQMPPTNFFLGSSEADNEDEDDENHHSESILDLAARAYPAQMLEWHYRSRSEALIAFSNRAFYGGRLIAPPNAMALGKDGALRYISVADAYFTQKTGNPVEAERVVAELAKILQESPNQSVGIIAMGQSQRACLELAIERWMTGDSTFALAFKTAEAKTEGDASAGLFLKNLENVQGDERDIILISTGYAAARPGKKLVLNFGPLSKTGGSRRLNVAITRARSKLIVFSSFSPDDIPTDESAFASNPDATCFGRYLKYVRAVSAGDENAANSVLGSFGVGGILTRRKPSGFARDVARRLAERGRDISIEVGTSGFFIDIAIHHPRIPGNFILGIECDGAMFHSSAYARDRDKAREKLLIDRGWRIIRVWGPDWSRSWQTELERIESKIAEILTEAP